VGTVGVRRTIVTERNGTGASPPFDRRRFLGASLGFGVGAAAIVLGGGAESWASTSAKAAPLAAPYPEEVRTFVSRPDLVPPGVSIVRAPDLLVSELPSHIFLAPHIVASSPQPQSSAGLMILDADGELVWWQELPADQPDPFNFRVQQYQGQAVITWFQGEVNSAFFPTDGVDVIADDTYTPIRTVNAVGYRTDPHEFLITPEDTALVTANNYGASVDGAALVIGHAQEVTIGANELVWDWASYPAVPPSASTVAGDYFHINSIDLWPGTDRDVLISARNTSAVYLVSRATKEIVWRLGGTSSSFAMGSGTTFSYQHDARPLADGSGLSLFDDASTGYPERQSWGKVIDLDPTSAEATLVSEFRHATKRRIDTPSQGNCQLLDTGGYFVGWGAVPYFSLFGPPGAGLQPPLVLDGRMPNGIQNYRAFMFDWVGRPAESELVLVVHHGVATDFTGYTSWNGATEVAYYEILAGDRWVLNKAGKADRNGFETVFAFDARGATDFQVAAFDAAGALLGSSTVVGVTASAPR
jgi:hypothetical protein